MKSSPRASGLGNMSPMTNTEGSGLGIYLTYRHPGAGPLGKRVARLGADTVLGWFQRAWARALAARDHAEFDEWLLPELGGAVYGLGSLFSAARQHGLGAPTSVETLGELLGEHLHTEGSFYLDEHTLCVHGDDDEMGLAYYFFDEAYARANPDRVAFLIHDEPRLPDSVGDGGYEPPADVPLSLLPEAEGQGATYACFVAYYSTFQSRIFDNPRPLVARGVRLPEFADYLRSAEARGWPFELRLLRALASDGRSLGETLCEASRYPLRRMGGEIWRAPDDDAAAARREFEAVAPGLTDATSPPADARTRLELGEHVAVLCADVGVGYFHLWIVFDDLWASAHRDMASSLLRHVAGWDVFATGEPCEPEPLFVATAPRQEWFCTGCGCFLDQRSPPPTGLPDDWQCGICGSPKSALSRYASD
jgi:hypothetical protein